VIATQSVIPSLEQEDDAIDGESYDAQQQQPQKLDQEQQEDESKNQETMPASVELARVRSVGRAVPKNASVSPLIVT